MQILWLKCFDAVLGCLQRNTKQIINILTSLCDFHRSHPTRSLPMQINFTSRFPPRPPHPLPPKTYRTSPIENISKIHQTYNIYRTFLEHLSNIYRTFLEHLSTIYRTFLEHLSNIYRTAIEHLPCEP